MIVNSITDNFFAYDKDWRFTYLNKHAQEQMKVLHKDPARLIGKVLWDEFPSVPNEEVLRRAMSQRIVMIDELYCPPLGEWVENHIYPSSDGGLVTFQRYVTSRKRAERELLRSQAYLAEGQRLSQTGSWAWNVSAGELFWTPEVFRLSECAAGAKDGGAWPSSCRFSLIRRRLVRGRSRLCRALPIWRRI